MLLLPASWKVCNSSSDNEEKGLDMIRLVLGIIKKKPDTNCGSSEKTQAKHYHKGIWKNICWFTLNKAPYSQMSRSVKIMGYIILKDCFYPMFPLSNFLRIPMLTDRHLLGWGGNIKEADSYCSNLNCCKSQQLLKEIGGKSCSDNIPLLSSLGHVWRPNLPCVFFE